MEGIILSSSLPDQFLELMQIDYVTLILAIATIAVGVLAIKKFIDEFASAFGFVPIWTRKRIELQQEREQIKAQLNAFAENQKEFKTIQENNIQRMEVLSSGLAGLKDDISKLDERIDKRERDKEFRRLRWRIINFANELPDREVVSLEVWNEVWDGIKKYEDMCEKYKYKNGQTTSSVKVITSRYEHDIALGKIIKEED